MQLNSLHAVRMFVDLIDDKADGAIAVGIDVARQLLQRSNLEAMSKKTLRRLAPDIDLEYHFPDQEHLSISDVLRVLGSTKERRLDVDLIKQAVQEAAEEEEPEYQSTHQDDEYGMHDNSDDDFSHEEEVVEAQTEVVTHRPEKSKAVVVHADEYGEDGKPVYRLDDTPSEALVIHCGDPRFQKAFKRFLSEELGISNYTPIIIGGGLHSFGVQAFLPKNFKILWEQIKFFIQEGKLGQIIFINHEDCQWYHKMKGYHPAKKLPIVGRLDLRTAAERIVEDFAKVEVRSFFAAIKDDQVVFEEVK